MRGNPPSLKSQTSTVRQANPLPLPHFLHPLLRLNGMQSVLPNNIYGLRVAEDLAVCVGEVRHDDETPPRIAPGEAACPLPRVHKGLSYQGACRPPMPTGGNSTIARATSRAHVRALRIWRLPTPPPCTGGAFSGRFQPQPGTGLGGE